VALKLHSEYGFSYNNLKVLLGGWYGWQSANAQNPTTYPIEVGPHATTFNYRDSLREGRLKRQTWLLFS
jgi:hypothetical protein